MTGQSGKQAPRYRHEYKYFIDARQLTVLRLRAEALLRPDSHVGAGGSYRVRSLYFDDWANSCLAENEAGTDARAKFRIRMYGQDTGFLSLEKKIKYRGLTRKIAARLTQEDCLALAEGRIPSPALREKGLRELCTEMQIRGLRPAVTVLYDRIPFVYPAGNVRVTFDTNIASADPASGFLIEPMGQRPVLPAGQSILEVKWEGFLPSWLQRALELESLRRTSFSKYYVCRVFNVWGGIKR